MRENKKRIVVITLGTVMLAASGAWWWNSEPERMWGCFRNEYACCVGCRSFISSGMDQYLMEKKDQWLPRGGETPADSLCVLLKWSGRTPQDTHNFTCHKWMPRLQAYFDIHGTMSYDAMCYRYNEGLRADDPQDLIVMYYYRPTLWENSQMKRNFVGRPVMTLELSPSWKFLPEDEFQRRQKETEDYLRDNNRITTDSTVPSEGAPSDGQ